MATLTLTSKQPGTVAADVLVLAVAQGRSGPRVLGADLLPAPLRRWLTDTLPALGVTGAADQVHRVPSGGQTTAPVLALTGIGAGADRGTDPEALRRAAGAAARNLTGVRTAAFALPVPDTATLAAVAEGALLGAYTFTRYRSSAGEPARPALANAVICTPQARTGEAKAAARRAGILAEAVAITRDLVNTPPSDLYPAAMAEQALAAVDGLPVSTTVLDERKLGRGGYGGLLAVGMGSSRPPRLVRLDYAPAGARTHLALVGKGITFDSGGLSIKPAKGMETMKCDMAGAAAVLGTVVAAARLALPVHVSGWLAVAENMPSGTAQRPSDVITIRGGRTVEVLNTDAEGRLVLADALVAAGETDPDLIVDVATLTGAQQVALGNRVSAVMANDDQLRERIHRLATAAGEQFWPMPLPRELRSSLDSPVADLANMGDRFGGMLVAGLFLAEFVPTRKRPAGPAPVQSADAEPAEAGPAGAPAERAVPWAHLDIAGPAFNAGSAHGYTPAGGTGVAVRTLLQLVEDVAAAGH